MTKPTENRVSTKKRAIVLFALIVVVPTLIAGCAPIGPKPWEKDLLARREMQLNSYPLQTTAEDHIYFSKEAASGGRGFAGGGCGCN